MAVTTSPPARHKPPRIAAVWLAAASLAAAPGMAGAASESPGAAARIALDEDPAAYTLDPVVVTAAPYGDGPPGSIRLGESGLSGMRARTSDTARLLEDLPGVSLYGAGGISALPALHGIADDRLRTQVDGMDLMTACPNHMNPALSFIDPSRVARVAIYAGIAPVSVGGDSIGGTIQVNSAPPRFAKDDGVLAEGQVGSYYRSNGQAKGGHIGATLANRRLSLSYGQSFSESGNYRAGGLFKLPGIWQSLGERAIPADEVAASEYGGAVNRDLGLALKLPGNHLVELNLGEQRLDYEGFPNQRMDMVYSAPDPADPTQYLLDKAQAANLNRLVNLRYTGQYPWGELEARLFRQRLQHHMDMLQDRFAGMYMPMDTEATTVGGLIKASIELSDRDLLRVGGDFQNYRLDDWWPPIGSAGAMCCEDFWNIRDGKRDRVGVFAEWEADWSPQWLSLLGMRGATVESDAGPVQGYNNTYAGDAGAFNALPHQRTDHHLDLTALARYTPDAGQTYEAGIARKTRSPNLYERYPWSTNAMAWVMNNFVGDGNGYIGNLDLKPETAYTLSASGAWHDPSQEGWRLKVTGHVTYVHDYINAERCDAGLSALCTAQNATTSNKYVLLQYVNHNARLHGIDLSGQRALGRMAGLGSFTGTGVLSYLQGEDTTTGDPLYHLMPLNAKFALTQHQGGWTSTAEVVLVAGKKQVSQVRNEVRTGGYGLLNLRGSYAWKRGRLDLAMENVFDRLYLMPLGGAYLGQGNAMTTNAIPWGMGVPGMGRSLNVALNLQF